MKSRFLQYLNCPNCGNSLRLLREPNEDIFSGELSCASRHVFPIVRGVPRFVSGESYTESFGFEWNIHSRTQLDTPVSHDSERAFLERTGFIPEELDKTLILDVGCGMGRFSEVAQRWGATVVGIDHSDAIDAAQNYIGARPNVHLAQADIFKLPFADETFDYVFSIGVLHHTPNTRAAFQALPRLLKPGGKIAIWVYDRRRSGRWLSSDAIRQLTTRLPKSLLHRLCRAAVPLYFFYRIPGPGHLGRFFFPISMDPRPEWRVLDTFDWYSPKYQWKHSADEVSGWFEAEGLTEIRLLRAPISTQGTRKRTYENPPRREP